MGRKAEQIRQAREADEEVPSFSCMVSDAVQLENDDGEPKEKLTSRTLCIASYIGALGPMTLLLTLRRVFARSTDLEYLAN